MAKRKVKDTTDEKGLNTSPEEEGQGNQDPAAGTPPAGDGENDQDPVPGTSPSPEEEGQGNQDPTQGTPLDTENTATYEIICRNKINKTIGGVMFVDGVGHTKDGYAASWFRNKEGYEVTKIK